VDVLAGLGYLGGPITGEFRSFFGLDFSLFCCSFRPLGYKVSKLEREVCMFRGCEGSEYSIDPEKRRYVEVELVWYGDEDGARPTGTGGASDRGPYSSP
jgi:hypothetical protein